MEDKKLVIPALVGANGDDVATWALPEGAIARLGQGIVEALAFSPDGDYLAIGTRVGLWLYELETMSPVALWDTERGIVSKVAFSPDGKWIATGNWDKVTKVLDVRSGICVTQIILEEDISTLAFSSDSQWLATSDDSDTATINIWHPETGEMLTKFVGKTEKGGSSMPIVFSSDTRLLASTGRNNTDNDAESIIVWDVESGEQADCFTGHIGSIHSLCFSPCGKFLASGGRADGTVHVWDVVSGGQIKIHTGDETARMIPSYSLEGVLRVAEATNVYTAMHRHDGTVTVRDLEKGEKLYTSGTVGPIGFSNGSRLAYKCVNLNLSIWTLGDSYPREVIQSPISDPRLMVFSADGKTLTAEYRHGEVLLWDITNKRPRPAINAEPTEQKQHLYICPSGKNYVTTINTNTVKLWDVDNGSVPIAEFTGHEDEWVRPAFAPAANLLACADKDGNLTVWNVQTGAKHREFAHPFRDPKQLYRGAPEEMHKLVLSPDGRFLASETDTHLNAKLWDVENGLEIFEFPGDKIVELGGFSPCGRYLIHRGGKESNTLWDTEHRESISLQYVFTCGYSWFVYSPCGTYLAGCGGEETEDILVWNLDSQDTHIRIPLPSGCKAIMALAFSQCGRYLAGSDWWESGYEKLPICLWEVETGKHIGTFWGHPTDVQGLAFSPNNEFLASASYDGTILLWDLDLICRT